ncbi:MAG: radical SAM family heme chaperone HemW [Bacteroidetes bacterium]|nr:radical SAM family heme chaperone HemW [Bacteroidota bacterium]MBT6836617.1 radical SAM family heme chaperone HemW [Bacteroidota bacterium]
MIRNCNFELRNYEKFNRLAGIYIHIPFCRTACDYCNFHFSTSLKRKGELVKAMQQELALRKDYLNAEQIDSIYFGGGSPSVLDVSEIQAILQDINLHYDVIDNAEISLEANPDDLSLEKLSGLREIGVNRLSIGIQSFLEEELKTLGRIHSAKQAITSIENARKTGFSSLTIDLIYGIQNSSLDSWQENLDIMKSLQLDHFSSYALTVEPKTVFAHKIKKGAKKEVDEELLREQYFMLKKFAKANSFNHYEISNFSKEGFYSIHNTNYWKHKKYVGIGPSAHSFDLKSRRWNMAVNADYISKIRSGEQFWDEEQLSRQDQFNEKLMLGLRTMWGVDLEELFKVFNATNKHQFLNRIEYYEQMEFIKREDSIIRFTDEGILFSDQIISDLFIEE